MKTVRHSYPVMRHLVLSTLFVWNAYQSVQATPMARQYSWSFQKGNLVANWSFEGEAQGWLTDRANPQLTNFYTHVQALIGTPTGQFCGWAQGSFIGSRAADVLATTPIRVQPGVVSFSVKYRGTGNGDVRPALIVKTPSGETVLTPAATQAYVTSSSWTRYVWQSVTIPSGAQSMSVVLARSSGMNANFDLTFDDVLVIYHTDTERDIVAQEDKIAESVDFVDGAGNARVSYTKLEESSGQGYLVSAQTLDAFGRPLRAYLPFVRFGAPHSFTQDNQGADPGGILESEILDRATVASRFQDPVSNGTAPYLEAHYADLDPNVKAAGAVAQSWRPGAAYQNVAANGLSGTYFVPDTAMSTLPASIGTNSPPAFADASLEFRWSKSPEGAWSLTWINALGQTIKTSILEATPAGDLRSASWIHTAYEYFPNGALRKVFTDATLRTAAKTDFQELQQIDGRGRVVATVDPVRGLVRTWYDHLGRARLTQTALQRAKLSAWYTEYDRQGRTISEGLLKYTAGADLQSVANREVLASGVPVTSTTEYKGFIYDTLTIAAFTALAGSGPPEIPTNSWGRMVCAYNRNPEATVNGAYSSPQFFVADVYSYDYLGRLSKAMRYNGAAAEPWAITATIYSANGDPQKVQLKPYMTSPTLTQAYAYQYDRFGRVKQINAEVNGSTWPPVLPLARYDYSDLGDLNAVEWARTDLGKGLFRTAAATEYAYHQQGMLRTLSGRAGQGQQVAFQELGYDRQTGTSALTTVPPVGQATLRKDGSITSIYSNWGINTPAGSSRSEIETFQYDPANRMTKSSAVTFPGSWNADQSQKPTPSFAVPWSNATVEMSYDKNGRIVTQKNGLAGSDQVTATYGFNAKTYKLNSVEGSIRPGTTRSLGVVNGSGAFSWDLDGQMTYDRSKRLRVYWGADGMPWKMSVNSVDGYTNASYQTLLYDAQGDLAARVRGVEIANPGGSSTSASEAKIYVTVGGIGYGEVNEVYTWNGSVRSVATAPIQNLQGVSGPVGRVLPDGTREYFLKDYQGSALRTVRSDGARDYTTQTVMDYHPFGQQLAMQQNAAYPLGPTWTGKEFETLDGLYYFGARWYDPELGMWISPDPAGQFHNPYAYSSNPVMYTDPDGRFLWIIAIVAIGAAINIGTNASNINSVWDGVGYGAIGGTQGFISAVGGPLGIVAGGMLTGSLNASMSGGNIVAGGVLGGLTSGVGLGIGAAMAPALGKVTQGLASPMAKAFVGGTIGSTVAGTVLGGTGAALSGGNFWDGAIQGGVLGLATGGVSAMAMTGHILSGQGRSPWTGKPLPGTTADLEQQCQIADAADVANERSESVRRAEVSSSKQAENLKMQYKAEEVVGGKLPDKVEGYTSHGINQAIGRDGGAGVSTAAIRDAVMNPIRVEGQPVSAANFARGITTGQFMMVGRYATVIMNTNGQVVTAWATTGAGLRGGK